MWTPQFFIRRQLCLNFYRSPVPIMLANAVLVGAMLAYVLTPTALVQGFFINGGEVLLGEAVVLYLLGVPLLVFFRKNGVMEKLMKEKR